MWWCDGVMRWLCVDLMVGRFDVGDFSGLRNVIMMVMVMVLMVMVMVMVMMMSQIGATQCCPTLQHWLVGSTADSASWEGCPRGGMHGSSWYQKRGNSANKFGVTMDWRAISVFKWKVGGNRRLGWPQQHLMESVQGSWLLPALKNHSCVVVWLCVALGMPVGFWLLGISSGNQRKGQNHFLIVYCCAFLLYTLVSSGSRMLGRCVARWCWIFNKQKMSNVSMLKFVCRVTLCWMVFFR